MKRSFIHPGTTATMSFYTGFYRDPKPQATTFIREPTNYVGSTAKQNFIPIMLFTDIY